jgi:hypothetical protein
MYLMTIGLECIQLVADLFADAVIGIESVEYEE